MPARFVEVPVGLAVADLSGIPLFNFTVPSLSVTLHRPAMPDGPALYALAASVALFILNVLFSRAFARRALREFGKKA